MSTDSLPFPISDNIQAVVQSIRESALRVGRDSKDIQLVAATKMVSPERMRQAHKAGIRIFGENRLQEAQQKQKILADINDVSWHFIGQVQRRKIKHVVGQFDLIHSVESLEQAREMNKHAKDFGMVQDVLLQVNVSGESTKGGYSLSDCQQALPELDTMNNINVRGLMTIPPWSEDIESTRPYFRKLREFADTVRSHGYENIRMDSLSMGMSQDFPIAVEEGATFVRVGTGLFGSRKPVV